MNPSEYVTRFTSNNKNLPSCRSHYDLLDFNTVLDFLFSIPYAAHGKTHGSIGGVYGCDIFDPLRLAGYIIDEVAQVNLCKNWVFYLKEFYRNDYIVPMKNCSSDLKECGFVCEASKSQDIIFALTNILNSDFKCVPITMSEHGWTAWKDFICTETIGSVDVDSVSSTGLGKGYKIFGGDHLESSSPQDPSFWPIHPTLERVLHAKLMAGGFLNNTWANDVINEYVCDKGSCLDTKTSEFGYWEGCCYGHYLGDKLLDPFSDAYNISSALDERVSYTGPTNQEIIEGTDPTSDSYSMTYIYDNVNWNHCNDSSDGTNYDFTSHLKQLYQLSVERSQLSSVEIQAIIEATSNKIENNIGGLKNTQ